MSAKETQEVVEETVEEDVEYAKMLRRRAARQALEEVEEDAPVEEEAPGGRKIASAIKRLRGK